eukprot:5941344-Prymnesium_polylepis.1
MGRSARRRGRHARLSGRTVRTVRVREGTGGDRSRVGEERHERSGAVRAVGGRRGSVGGSGDRTEIA